MVILKNTVVASYVLSGTRYGQPKKGDNGGGHAVVLINLIQERQKQQHYSQVYELLGHGMEWGRDI